MAHHATCGRHTQTDTDQADAHDDSVTDTPCDTDRVRATQGQHTVAQPAQNQTHRLDPTASHGARSDTKTQTETDTQTQTQRHQETETEPHRQIEQDLTLSDTKTQTEKLTQRLIKRTQTDAENTERHRDTRTAQWSPASTAATDTAHRDSGTPCDMWQTHTDRHRSG